MASFFQLEPTLTSRSIIRSLILPGALLYLLGLVIISSMYNEDKGSQNNMILNHINASPFDLGSTITNGQELVVKQEEKTLALLYPQGQ